MNLGPSSRVFTVLGQFWDRRVIDICAAILSRREGASGSPRRDAIVAAIQADTMARHERDEAARRRREEAFRAAMRRPLCIALLEPKRSTGRPSE